ncbi:tRNA1(Val) (adenine(37)-N6)-methyltransferase [Caldalkalibacillus salinus]|uniref:tRNA1(Val) (adenine(37)-N6)-methyltransferase n=1 Tax=Caldalkalibacillus salinus TaxID=2803787 RepID=UPI001924FDB4|nr:tRNA1(Val) (adenine(37)-N6)-methyltransferase [Caldalkalibacillus salinus]
MLKDHERLDYVLNEEIKIIQSPEIFSFSMDAILLAKFAYLPLKRGRVLDLCTGNGVIPFLLAQRTKATIEGVEIQDKVFDMAQRSLALNKLEDQVKFYRMDIKNAPSKLGHGRYDVVTCNPPYMPVTTGEKHHNEHFAIARHEIYCELEDVIHISSQLVRPGGKVALVHRPSRLIDIVTFMRAYRLEPKRVRFIHPKSEKEANMVLIEALKDGKPELTTLSPLIVYDENDQYTEALKEIYYG